MASHERRLGFVYGIVFVAFLDNFAMLPTVGPYARELGAGAFGIGVAVAAYSVTNLVANLVGGALLDRLGRKRLAVAGLVIAAAGVGAYTVAATPAGLVGARLLHGVGGGLLVPALFTLLGDLARPGTRGRAMGRAGAFIGAAAVVGPAFAGVLRGAAGFPAVFLTLVGVLLLGLVVSMTKLRETMPGAGQPDAGEPMPEPDAGEARPGADRQDAGEPMPPVGRVLSRTELVLAVAAVFAFTSSLGTLAAFLPGQVEALDAPPALSGGLFATLSGVAAILMLSPVARWVDRRGPAGPIRLGMALFVIALALLWAGGSVVVAVVAAVVFGVGFGVLFPAATGAVAIAAPLRGRGRAFGAFMASYSLGFIVGAPLAGAMDATAGLNVYATAAVLCTAVLAGATAAGRRTPARPTRSSTR